jgi:hypothetical protein
VGTIEWGDVGRSRVRETMRADSGTVRAVRVIEGVAATLIPDDAHCESLGVEPH